MLLDQETESKAQKCVLDELVSALRSELQQKDCLILRSNAMSLSAITHDEDLVELKQIICDKDGQLANLNQNNTLLQKESYASNLQLQDLIRSEELLSAKYSILEENHAKKIADVENLASLNRNLGDEISRLTNTLRLSEDALHVQQGMERSLRMEIDTKDQRLISIETELEVCRKEISALLSKLNRTEDLHAIEVLRISTELDEMKSANLNVLRSEAIPDVSSTEKPIKGLDEVTNFHIHDMLAKKLAGHEQDISELKSHKSGIESAVAFQRSSMERLTSKLSETEELLLRITNSNAPREVLHRNRFADSYYRDASDTEIESESVLEDNDTKDSSFAHEVVGNFFNKEMCASSTIDVKSRFESSVSKLEREKAFITDARLAYTKDKEHIKSIQARLDKRRREWKVLKLSSSTEVSLKELIAKSGEILNSQTLELNRMIRENKNFKIWIDRRAANLMLLESFHGDQIISQDERTSLKTLIDNLDSDLHMYLHNSSHAVTSQRRGTNGASNIREKESSWAITNENGSHREKTTAGSFPSKNHFSYKLDNARRELGEIVSKRVKSSAAYDQHAL